MLSLKCLGSYKIAASLLLSSTCITAGCQGIAVQDEIAESNFHLSRSAGSPRAALYIIVGLDPAHDFSDGLAHYTEHLVWNNISNAGEIKSDQHSNAWTNHSTIGYWLSGSKEDFPVMLKQLSSLFEPISVSEAFAKEEANIVLRERDYRLGNNVDADARIRMDKFLYQGNPLALTVIGESSVIGNMNLEKAKALHKATHFPENSVLIVIGDFSRSDVNKTINASGIPALSMQTVSTTPTPFKFAGNGTEKIFIDKLDVQTRIMWRKLIKLENPMDFEVLDLNSRVLSYFLESNLPGGLAGPLRYQEFVASSFSVNVYPIDEQHVEIRFSAFPDSGVSLEQLQSAYELALNSSLDGIPTDTFDRIKERKGSYEPNWNNSENVAGWMKGYVRNRVSVWREPLTVADLWQNSVDMSLEGVNELLKALGNPGRQAVTYFTSTHGEVQ